MQAMAAAQGLLVTREPQESTAAKASAPPSAPSAPSTSPSSPKTSSKAETKCIQKTFRVCVPRTSAFRSEQCFPKGDAQTTSKEDGLKEEKELIEQYCKALQGTARMYKSDLQKSDLQQTVSGMKVFGLTDERIPERRVNPLRELDAIGEFIV